MRPNRIGVWPLAMNSILSSAVVDMNRYDLTSVSNNFAVVNSNRTAFNMLEILGGEFGGDIFDTVYSRWHCYAGSGDNPNVISLFGGPQAGKHVRFTLGGFVRAPALQTVSAVPQPCYVRLKGWASAVVDASGSNPGNSTLLLQPVIAVKLNDSAPSVGSDDAAKATRRCAYATALPIQHTHSKGLNSARELLYAEMDHTIALAQTFTRTGGVGFPGDTIFGVGWSFYNPFHNVQGNNGRVNLEPEVNASMSAWFYTADFDMFDPNKS